MKKILKAPLYVLIIIAVIILSAVYIYFFTTLPENEVNNWLDKITSRNLGLQISFQRVNRDIWNGLTVEGIEIYSQNDSKTPIGYISKLQAAYKLADLWKGNYTFRAIDIDSIYFHYPEGGFEIPQKTGISRKKATLFNFDRIGIRRADIVLPNGEQIHVDSLLSSLTVENGNPKFTLLRVQADWPDRHFKIPAMLASVRSDSLGLEIDSLYIATERSRINLSGRVNKPFAKNLDLRYVFSPIDFADIDSVARIKVVGSFTANGTIKGAFNDFIGDGFADGSLYGRPIENATISYAFHDKILEFSSFDGMAFRAAFVGSGALNFGTKPPSYTLDGSVSHLDLREIGPVLKTDFTGDLHLDGAGFNELDFQMGITANLRQVRIETYYFDEVSGPVRFDLKRIEFLPGLTGRYKNTYVDAVGTLEYQGVLDVTGKARFEDLTNFTNQLFIRQLGGKGQADYHLTGPTNDFTIQASFKSDSCWTYGLIPGHLDVNMDLETFITHQVGTVNGRWSGGTLYSVATDSGFFIASVSGAKTFIDTAHVESPLGNVTMKGEYDGIAVPPVFYADTVYGIAFDNYFNSKEPLSFDILPNSTKFDRFIMSYGTGTIQISGKVSNDLVLDLNVEANGFQIGPFVKQVYTDKTINGIWSGKADISGNFDSPVMNFDLAIDSLNINNIPLGNLYSLASYKNGYIHSDSTWLLSEFGNYYVTGTLPMNLSFGEVQTRFPYDPIDLKLISFGKRLLLAEVFIPNVERLETNFYAEMNLTGTYANPLVTGYGRISNGTLKVLELVNPLTNVNAYLRMKNETIYIDSVSASAKGSREIQNVIAELLPGEKEGKEIPRLNASGTMTLLELGQFAYDIDIKGRNFYFMTDAYDIQGIADFNMQVLGERVPTVSGDAFLKRLDVRDEFPRFVPREIDTTFIVEDSTIWNLNIHVQAVNKLWIVNNDVNAECKADVIVERNLGILNLFGTVDIIRGTYNLFGQKFNVKSGSMVFNNVSRIDPNIDLDVTTRLRNPAAGGGTPTPVEIQITGTFLEPQINMAGETAMTKDEFLRLLVTGSEFNPFALGPETQGSLSANILRSFSTVSSFIPDPIVSSGLVQEFEITPADTGSGTQISVARYISPSLYVRYSHTIAQGQTQAQTQPQQSSGTIEVEYYLNNNVSFQVARGTQGSPNEGISFDINLNFEF